jgi:hypothetical protein
MHVYEDKFSVANLRRACEHRLPLSSGEIDIGKLDALLETILRQDIRVRRQELLLTQDPKLGISMQTALVSLVYYSLIDGRDCLQ